MSTRRPAAFAGLIKFLASGTYLGYSPLASGTFGSLWGIPAAFWLSSQRPLTQGVILIFSILFSVFISGEAAGIWGEKDPSKVVLDEIVGYMTAMAFLPFSWATAWTGFVVFRVMDVWKPFPIRNIDRDLPGGWGIVLDDVLAGVYTQVLLRFLLAYRVL